MSLRTHLTVTSIIFLIVAVVHLYRAIMGFEVHLGETDIPLWASWAGFLIAGFLSYSGLRLRR